MSLEKNFNTFYEKELQGLLIPLETQRKKIKKYGAAGFILLGTAVILFIISAASHNKVSVVIAFVLLLAAFVTNLVLGQFNPGFTGQPVAHTLHFWNFAGMTLAGLAFALAGGCPGRQLFLSGEGDGDAAVFVIGMVAGAAFAHNFGLASSPAGIGAHGAAAVAIGIVVCLFIGFTMRTKLA